MLQLFGLIVLSWLLLKRVNKEDLSVIGLRPTFMMIQWAMGLFIISAAIAASGFLFRNYFLHETYRLNLDLNAGLVMKEFGNQFRMVMTEELLFRGALLYILICKVGGKIAILLSSIFFGLIHVINPVVWTNLPQILMLFVFTFSMGLILAYAFVKSKSIWLPFAIHFGWNLVQNYVFSAGNGGNQLFIVDTPAAEFTVSYMSFFVLFFLPKLMVLSVNALVIKKLKFQ